MNIFNKLFGSKQQVDNTPKYLPFSAVGKMGGLLGTIFEALSKDASFDHLQSLNQARNYAITESVIVSFLRTMQNNVIGHTGYTLQSKFNAKSMEENSEINTLIEYAWYDFCKKENFDISGRFNLTEFLHHALKNYLIDGEIVIRIHAGGKYGIQLQLLRFDDIDYKLNTGRIFNGVEVDNYSRPIAYHIKSTDRKTSHRVPAEEIIHLANLNNPGTYRGISFLVSVLPLIKDINSYRKAEIQARMNLATNVLVYEADYQYGRAYEGPHIENTKVKPTNTPPATGSELAIAARNTIAAYESSTIAQGGLAIEALTPGVHLKKVGGDASLASSPEYLKSFYKLLAAGLGISYLTLMQDLDASTYSGARATALLERPTYKRFRTLLIENVVDKIYNLWLPNCLRMNVNKMPKINNRYDAYYEHEFMGLGFDYINPKDEAEAQKVALEAGIITYSSVLAERGIDFDDHLITIKKEQEKMAKYGIFLGKPEEKAVKSQEKEPKEAENVEKKPLKKTYKPRKKVKEDDEITVINGD